MALTPQEQQELDQLLAMRPTETTGLTPEEEIELQQLQAMKPQRRKVIDRFAGLKKPMEQQQFELRGPTMPAKSSTAPPEMATGGVLDPTNPEDPSLARSLLDAGSTLARKGAGAVSDIARGVANEPLAYPARKAGQFVEGAAKFAQGAVTAPQMWVSEQIMPGSGKLVTDYLKDELNKGGVATTMLQGPVMFDEIVQGVADRNFNGWKNFKKALRETPELVLDDIANAVGLAGMALPGVVGTAVRAAGSMNGAGIASQLISRGIGAARKSRVLKGVTKDMQKLYKRVGDISDADLQYADDIGKQFGEGGMPTPAHIQGTDAVLTQRRLSQMQPLMQRLIAQNSAVGKQLKRFVDNLAEADTVDYGRRVATEVGAKLLDEDYKKKSKIADAMYKTMFDKKITIPADPFIHQIDKMRSAYPSNSPLHGLFDDLERIVTPPNYKRKGKTIVGGGLGEQKTPATWDFMPTRHPAEFERKPMQAIEWEGPTRDPVTGRAVPAVWDDPRHLHAQKVALNKMWKGMDRIDGTAQERRAITTIASMIDDALMENIPDNAPVKTLYKKMIDKIKTKEAGLAGKMRRVGEHYEFEKVSPLLMQMEPAQISAFMGELDKVDPAARAGLFRAQISSQLDKLPLDVDAVAKGMGIGNDRTKNIATLIRSKLFKDYGTRKKLSAMADANSKFNLDALDKMLGALAEGKDFGSPTELYKADRLRTAEIAKAASELRGPSMWQIAGRALRILDDKNGLRADEALARALADPTWTKQWRQIRESMKVGRPSATTMAIFTRLIQRVHEDAREDRTQSSPAPANAQP